MVDIYCRYGKLENGLLVRVPQALVQRLKQVSEMRSDLLDNGKGQGNALYGNEETIPSLTSRKFRVS